MRKALAGLVAGALIIGGASVAMAQSSPTTTADTATTAPGPGTGAPETDRPHPLQSVLADLVGNGTITQAQADAITSAMDTKMAELRAAREAKREQMQAVREQVKSFLADGVITSDELAQLPAGTVFTDPNGPLADALADGQITIDELKAAHLGREGHHRGARPGGFGAPAASGTGA